MVSPGLEVKVKAFLAILNDDIEHLQSALQRLDRLRGLLIKKDDAGLEKLLTDLALRNGDPLRPRTRASASAAGHRQSSAL